jgi:RNA polymerase sigma-70 factor (ECF subfamily)
MRLTKLLLASDAPARGASHALLALMLFNVARFPARLSEMDELISLREQDRSRWDARFIEEGHRHLRLATEDDDPTRYHVEAIIAAVHCGARHHAGTDWPKLVTLYQVLEQITGSPHVRINRWVAESHVAVTPRLWNELEELAASLPENDRYLVDAAEADLHERNGRTADALIAYRRALNGCASQHDRRYFERKLAGLVPT